jgi:hypothetical protein
MKSVLISLSVMLSLFAHNLIAAEVCAPDSASSAVPIRTHMREMYVLLEKVYLVIDQPEKQAELLDLLENIKCHLYKSYMLTPPSPTGLSPSKIRLAKIEYQGFVASALSLVSQLETASQSTDLPEIRRERMEAIITRLNKVVAVGHQKFRRP